ncbi:NAD-dependent epimerase/dehydratase family protein [Candidatus Protochlamydia phocaeensis]|uniref:NAD-dependent epimerase/dehydratase family protein n=1 Tax=Candidatus Protochlamydia phocaeensis TaxID=1414722 RepID=UPI00083945C6|nr:NAD-dependent epimerase/dehydratase family protein [Candidatus Protochlamydia phocaeensis]
MGKQVFITGAAGFIGFHAALQLHARGDHVIGYDNFNSYYDVQLKRDRARELTRRGIKILEGDIQQFEHLQAAIANHNTTHLLHLAAQAGVRYSLQAPFAYLQANVEGFLNILEICRQSPSIKLTYASSSSVYGLNKKVPFSIEDRTDAQASLYGVTKKTNELMAQTYNHLFGISVTGLRFFTVYGPWGRPDMAYFSFTKAILEGKPIEIYNRGNMQRDFTYIDDIVDGILAAIDREMPSAAVFNLGHHHPEQLLHLIAILESELGVKAQKILMPMQPGDVVSTFADIEESTQQLGFLPKVSLEEGLGRFVRWYKDYYKP